MSVATTESFSAITSHAKFMAFWWVPEILLCFKWIMLYKMFIHTVHLNRNTFSDIFACHLKSCFLRKVHRFEQCSYSMNIQSKTAWNIIAGIYKSTKLSMQTISCVWLFFSIWNKLLVFELVFRISLLLFLFFFGLYFNESIHRHKSQWIIHCQAKK